MLLTLLPCVPRFAYVPVTLVVRAYGSEPVPVVVDLVLPDDQPSLADAVAHSPPVLWAGPQRVCVTVTPGSDECVVVRACVAIPGIYDVNRLRVSVGNGHGGGVLGRVEGPQGQSLVRVVDAAAADADAVPREAHQGAP